MKKKLGSTETQFSSKKAETRPANVTQNSSDYLGARDKDLLIRMDEVNAIPQLAHFQGSRNAKARTTREPEIDNSELATVGGKKVVLHTGFKNAGGRYRYKGLNPNKHGRKAFVPVEAVA